MGYASGISFGGIIDKEKKKRGLIYFLGLTTPMPGIAIAMVTIATEGKGAGHDHRKHRAAASPLPAK